MGERKVLNKYIPADFDPSLIPRGKKLSSKDGTVPVRMMLPFSIQCSSCHTFMYRGRKFNSKKEAMGGPDGRYLGIQRWRFYIKCLHCSRPVTFVTDPKNADYEMESGGTRNYEVYKDKSKTEEEEAEAFEKEQKEDPMKALENRVLDSQREMADLDNLEQIKAMNARHVRILSSAMTKQGAAASSAAGGVVDAEARAVLAAIDERKKASSSDPDEADRPNQLTAEDEALVKSIRFGQKQSSTGGHSANPTIRRLGDQDEKIAEQRRQQEAALLEEQQKRLSEKAASVGSKARSAVVPIIKVKRRRPEPPGNELAKKKAKETSAVAGSEKANKDAVGGLSSLLGGYSSDSDSD